MRQENKAILYFDTSLVCLSSVSIKYSVSLHSSLYSYNKQITSRLIRLYDFCYLLVLLGNLNYLAPKYPTSIQFLLHVRDVVKTQNLKVGQNVPQNLVKISGHPTMFMLSRRPCLQVHKFQLYCNYPWLRQIRCCH